MMKDRAVLKWIYKNCGKRGRESVALILLNAFSAVCVTLFAMLSKSVVDCAENGDGEGLFRYAAILLTLIVFQMLCRIASSMLEAVSGGRAEMSLKTKVFSSLLYGDFARASERHSGDIMTRLTADVAVVGDTSVRLLPTLTSYLVRILASASALFLLDRRFALIFISCGILLTLIAGLFRKPLKSLHRKVQEKDSGVRSFMQEMTENLFAVKVFGIEEKVLKRADTLQSSLYRQKIKRKKFSVFATIGFSLAFGIGFLAAVSYGSYGILKGSMSFGTVVALIQLVNQLQSPVMGITGILPSVFSMIASAQRLIEASDCGTDCEKENTVTYDELKAIKAENVSFGYNGEDMLKDISFTVNKGGFVGVKGPSGVGKTTVFKLITGLYPPVSGEITIETKDGNIKPSKATRKLFSVVPQGNMLLSGTLKENLTLLRPDADDGQIREALRIACADFAYELPDGLNTLLSEGGAGLSEGQAQRIAVARALLGDGKILLMDESTSALDSETEERMLRNLRGLDGITVIFITHREAVLRICDEIIEIKRENGK